MFCCPHLSHLKPEYRQILEALFTQEVKPLMTIVANVNIIVAVRDIKDSLVRFLVGGNRESRGTPTQITKLALVVPLLVLGGANSDAQTTIIVMRNSTEIVAGSDSKSGSFNGTEITCKVKRVGEIFWSVAGFNPPDLMKEMVTFIHDQTPTFRGTVERFSDFAPPKLQIAFDNYRISSPKHYKWVLQHPTQGIDTTFFGMEGSIPMVAHVAFNLKTDFAGRIIVSLREPPKIHDGSVCPKNLVACGFATGHYEHIRSELGTYTWHPDIAPDIRSLIQKEIDADPADVGPPIRILRITRDGPRWMQNGEGCALGDIPTEGNKGKKAKAKEMTIPNIPRPVPPS
jgi:hypothetical protein